MRVAFFGLWAWLIIAIVLQVMVSYSMYNAEWPIRMGVDLVITLTAAIPLALYYMGLIGEHIGMKMFLYIALFFSIDLVLIWTASLVH